MLDVTGTWTVRGAASALKAGDVVPAGAIVEPRAPSNRSRIVVALFTGQVQTHDAVFDVPRRVEPGMVSRVWRAIVGNYRPAYVPTLTRGQQLSDGVARLGPNATLDLRAWHDGSSVPRQAELRRVTSGGQIEPARISPVTLPSDADAWRTVKILGVSTGLWHVAISASGSDPLECWVLVAENGRFEEVERAYREAVALTGTWPDDVPAESVQAFLRTYLLSLARQAGAR